MNILDSVSITTDTWLKNPPKGMEGFSIDAEFWRLTPEMTWEFRTFYTITPKSYTRLVKILVQSDKFEVGTSNKQDGYYGEKYDTASLTVNFNRKEVTDAKE